MFAILLCVETLSCVLFAKGEFKNVTNRTTRRKASAAQTGGVTLRIVDTPKPPDTPAEARLRKALASAGVRDYRIDRMLTFHRILENHKGCMTPEEDIILGLVTRYGVGRGGLTPEELDTLVAEFRADFNDIWEVAVRFQREHAALLRDGSPAAPGTRVQ